MVECIEGAEDQGNEKTQETLNVPEIRFLSPSPTMTNSSEVHDISDENVQGLRRHHRERKQRLRDKFRYPLIIGKLNSEAKRLFRFRNYNHNQDRNKAISNINHSPNLRKMDTLRVPTPNLIRKSSNSSIKPKVYKKLGTNNKPYYVLQDPTFNNLLYYNRLRVPSDDTHVKQSNISKTNNDPSRLNAATSGSDMKHPNNEQWEKLVNIEHLTSQHQEHATSQTQETLLSHVRVGWGSPVPFHEKKDGGKKFSYNFRS